MLSSKIDFITKYNSLVNFALKSSEEFPTNLCEFLVEEYELQSVVLFKVMENRSLTVLGKSSGAKKHYSPGTSHNCDVCRLLTGDQIITGSFNTQANCKIQTSEFLLNEGCIVLNVTDTEKAMLKIGSKNHFTRSDEDNIKIIAAAICNLLRLWMSKKGSLNDSLSAIVNDIAHELRTPTNSIMGFASLLNEENLTTSQSEYVSTLKENAYSLLSLLNDLIDIARLDNGIIKDTQTTVDIKSFINDILKLFTEKQANPLVEFSVNIAKEIPDKIKIDTQKIRYILINLITTSLRMTEKGKISISAALADNNKLNLRISDTSPGIFENKLKEIFKPFALNDLINNKIGNTTGLGLTLSKRYIDYMNGDISVTSTPGKGTTFSLSIPVELLSPVESQISSLPKASGKRNNVLVVEDDYATSKLLSNYLNKWGYEPVIVNSAEQALKIIDKESFLAILMDIILPDSNGLELLQKFREHRNTKKTPVIVCSVEAEQQKAFLMGAVEYFVKPIDYKYLVEVLTSYKLKSDSRVLIVDDDVPTLNLIREAVEQSGFQAVAESHSSRVMDLIENMDLDLAIIDLDMPEVTGFELIKQIKLKPNFSKLPVIIYTGKENYEDDLKKIDGLFEELLLKKSANIEDLADTVTAMINRFDKPSTPEEVKDKTDSVKILLVEDYKHSQIIVTRLLKKNNFDSIVVVENGIEAIEQVKQQKYDLILMDMQMPVMNGFEATEKIRQLDEYKDTPIIALTAFAMKGDREKCLQAGATDYIPKPIDSQEFIKKVRYYTQSKIKS
ncbi:MAG: hypothetical protein Kow0098_27320 [Ignavibacteriaceae bacterium]